MTIRSLVLATLTAASVAVIDPRAASAGTDSCAASREPPQTPPIVPGVIVLAAIGATVARMNRRGGPR